MQAMARKDDGYWRQQLFWARYSLVRCPCCDDYLMALQLEEDEHALSPQYCLLCDQVVFISRSCADWYFGRADDWDFAVTFHVPDRLRYLETPEGVKFMRGVWQEGPYATY